MQLVCEIPVSVNSEIPYFRIPALQVDAQSFQLDMNATYKIECCFYIDEVEALQDCPPTGV